MAEGFYRLVGSEQFLVSLFFLADILDPLAVLSKQFQVRNFHPFDVGRSVQACIDQLQGRFLGQKLKPGPNVQKLLGLLESKELVTIDEPRGKSQNKGAVFEKVKQESRKLAADTIDALTERLLRDRELLKNARIFVPATSQGLDLDSFHDFGNTRIVSLANYFVRFEPSSTAIVQEWNQLKYECLKPDLPKRPADWLSVLKEPLQRIEVFPNLAILAEILLCFCAENAEVERGFSLYNRIKSKVRNRLKINTVDMLMRLRLNSDKYSDFNYNKAAIIWLGMSKRGRYVVGKPTELLRQDTEQAEDEELSIEDEEAMDSIGDRAGAYEEEDEELWNDLDDME